VIAGPGRADGAALASASASGRLGKLGDEAVNARDREDAQDRGGGDDEQHLAAFGLGAAVRADQDANPGRVTKPGLRQVRHKRAAPAGGCVEQRCAQPGGVGHIDLLGRGHHGHAADQLDHEPVLRHCVTSADTRLLLKAPLQQAEGQGDQAKADLKQAAEKAKDAFRK
jgi:hypothetical protein